jgi:hypothetical protein
MRFKALAWTLVWTGTAFAVSPAAAQEPANPRNPLVAGTYALTVCRAACDRDSGRVLTTGRLVLEERPYDLSDIPEPARSFFETIERFLLHADAGGAPNACFTFENRGPGTLAGAARVGLTRWESSGDTLTVPLYHSPDAGYDVRARIVSGTLAGQGESWGPWDKSEDGPPDLVTGVRIGPPDRSVCVEAAERRLRELRRK